MKKWNLIIDVANCTNCNDCTLAVQDEYYDNDFPGYAASMPKHGHRWIEILHKERGQCPMMDVAYVPVMCQHCDDAPCIKAARDGAITKRADGIVIIDPVKSKGQKQIVDACPYGAVWWNKEKNIPQHWIFDAHLLDQGWTETRGSQVCATQAMQTLLVEDAEMERIIADQGLEQLHPEYDTKPRVWYKNLWRYNKCFIGGSLTGEIDGVIDCIAGARVTLVKDGSRISEAESDNYGEFKFDRLDPDSGTYTVEISAQNFDNKSVEVELADSIYLGAISL